MRTKTITVAEILDFKLATIATFTDDAEGRGEAEAFLRGKVGELYGEGALDAGESHFEDKDAGYSIILSESDMPEAVAPVAEFDANLISTAEIVQPETA